MFWKAIADAAFTTYDLSLAIAWEETSQESFERWMLTESVMSTSKLKVPFCSSSPSEEEDADTVETSHFVLLFFLPTPSHPHSFPWTCTKKLNSH